MLFFASGAARRGRLPAMSSLDRAQLSAIAATIDDATTRVAALGEQLDAGGTADAANALAADTPAEEGAPIGTIIIGVAVFLVVLAAIGVVLLRRA